jgi:hypothetical protein
MAEFPYKAKERVSALIKVLTPIVKRDPDQEVRGIAIPALDAVLEAVKAEIGLDNRVVAAIAGIITTEAIESGEPLMASDVLLVATRPTCCSWQRCSAPKSVTIRRSLRVPPTVASSPCDPSGVETCRFLGPVNQNNNERNGDETKRTWRSLRGLRRCHRSQRSCSSSSDAET